MRFSLQREVLLKPLAQVVNVVILASIIKRAKAQKKNPYKQEIFTDQRDFREAMERA